MLLVRTVRGYSSEPQSLNEPKSVYQSPSGLRRGLDPLLQSKEIGERDFTLLDSLEQMLP